MLHSRFTHTLRRAATSRAFGAAAAAAEPAYPAYVMGAPAPSTSLPPSGLRVGSLAYPGETATVTVMVDAGSRYETSATNGVANLLQLAALQGKAAEIAALGGHFTGFTSREHIVLEARVLKGNVAAATKLLGSMLAAPGDVAGAKAQMACTLAGAAARPEEVIMEHLHDAAYLDTSMGLSVLGTPETVDALTAEDVAAFAATNVTAARTVVTAAGAVDHAAFEAAVAEGFSGLPSVDSAKSLDAAMEPAYFTGSDKRMRIDSIPQAHVAFGFRTDGYNSEYAVPLMLMEALLGEFDTNNSTGIVCKNKTSKLAIDQGDQEAATVFKVFNVNYKDTGLFGAYFQAPDNRTEDAVWYTLWNIVRLCHKTTDEEVEFAKTQAKKKLTEMFGTNSGASLTLAKQFMAHGRPVPLAEMFARIDAVDAETIKETAKKFINDEDHALAAVGSIYELPDYNWIRRRSYWLRY